MGGYQLINLINKADNKYFQDKKNITKSLKVTIEFPNSILTENSRIDFNNRLLSTKENRKSFTIYTDYEGE